MRVEFWPLPSRHQQSSNCDEGAFSHTADLIVSVIYSRRTRWGGGYHECIKRRVLCKEHSKRYEGYSGYPFRKREL